MLFKCLKILIETQNALMFETLERLGFVFLVGS